MQSLEDDVRVMHTTAMTPCAQVSWCICSTEFNQLVTSLGLMYADVSPCIRYRQCRLHVTQASHNLNLTLPRTVTPNRQITDVTQV